MDLRIYRIYKKISLKTAWLCICAVFLGIGIGFVIKKPTEVSNVYSIRENTPNYTFVHPLLAVGTTTSDPSPIDQTLYDQVQSYIKAHSGVGDIASVYFADYNKGGHFMINQDELYAPSSLMKVVVMIAYFKKAETHEDLLSSHLVYQQSMQLAVQGIEYGTPSNLTVGQSYTVEELINKMIINSDNGAMNALVDNIGYPYLNTVYAALGLKGPTESSIDYKISVQDYSLFFRILYNATYLDSDMSEKALSILNKTTFNRGLVGGLPKGIVIAHKFGEHIYGAAEDTETVELHDCGFVYAHKDPYFICVMTHGTSIDALENIIQGISSIVYANATKR